MKSLFPLIALFFFLLPAIGQDIKHEYLQADTGTSFQQIVGFGGSLAYYENWVVAHPYKSRIYKALFDELNLKILRVRNAHDYDNDMINRVKEFMDAAESNRGTPVKLLSTSWGPPAYLKSNNDRKNGGTLRYNVSDGNVEFDYPAFAHWWSKSLDEYEAQGIYPTYISIQNEPDYTATWESCRLSPAETITSSDTIAGYNKALQAVHDTVQTRNHQPNFLGPESIGIGYNAVENYINALDLTLLHGIGHHLYHGANPDNSYLSDNFAKVGNFHPEKMHFQTEYSGGDWWTLAALLYMSLHEEQVVAYLYWDLVWPDGGLVDMDNPWNRTTWSNNVGYQFTKEFYIFKHFSAYVHPGWQRINISGQSNGNKSLAFVSPDLDSAAIILINTHNSPVIAGLNIPGFTADSTEVFTTSENENFARQETISDYVVTLPPRSVTTVSMLLSEVPMIQLVEQIDFPQDDTMIDKRKDSLQLVPEIFPQNASIQAVMYEIIDGQDLASIRQNGTIISLGTGDGTVTVKATAVDGSGIFATQEIVVTNQVEVSGITLNYDATVIDTHRGSVQFTAEVSPANASAKEVKWSVVQEDSIATINQEGLLSATGMANGNIMVVASAIDNSGVTVSAAVLVENQETTIQPMSAIQQVIIRHDNRVVYFDIPGNAQDISLGFYDIHGILLNEIRPEDGITSLAIPVPPGSGKLTIVKYRDNRENISRKIVME